MLHPSSILFLHIALFFTFHLNFCFSAIPFKFFISCFFLIFLLHWLLLVFYSSFVANLSKSFSSTNTVTKYPVWTSFYQILFTNCFGPVLILKISTSKPFDTPPPPAHYVNLFQLLFFSRVYSILYLYLCTSWYVASWLFPL